MSFAALIEISQPSIRYKLRVFSSLQAIHQQLKHGKVPCLCAVVKAFSLTEADASVLLKDPTGNCIYSKDKSRASSYELG